MHVFVWFGFNNKKIDSSQVETYAKELEEMQRGTKEEYLASLRRQSSGFSRGVSKYRGVARLVLSLITCLVLIWFGKLIIPNPEINTSFSALFEKVINMVVTKEKQNKIGNVIFLEIKKLDFIFLKICFQIFSLSLS